MTSEMEAGLRRALAAADYGDSSLPFATPQAECAVYTPLIEAGYLCCVGSVVIDHQLCNEYELTAEGRAAAEALPPAAPAPGRWFALLEPVLAFIRRTSFYGVMPTEKLAKQYQVEMRALISALGFRRGQHPLPHVQEQIRQQGTKRAVIACRRLRLIRAEMTWRHQPLPQVQLHWQMPERGPAPRPDTFQFDAALERRHNRRKKTAAGR